MQHLWRQDRVTGIQKSVPQCTVPSCRFSAFVSVCVCVGATSGRLRDFVGAFFVPWELPLPLPLLASPPPQSLPRSALASQSLPALDARAFWLSLRTTLGHFAFARQGKRTTRTSGEILRKQVAASGKS